MTLDFAERFMIHDIFRTLEPLIHAHGYWVVGLILLLENMGIPLPGELVLIACGVLSSTGQLDPWAVGLVAIAACIVGDNLGFLIGRSLESRYLSKCRHWGYLSDSYIQAARQLFLRYGNLAVFLGRFIALLRMLSGPLAGMLGMQWPTFFFYTSLGAIAWVGTILTASFYLGRDANLIFEKIGLWGVSFFALIVIILKWQISRRLVRSQDCCEDKPNS